MVEDATQWILDWLVSRTAGDYRRYAWFGAVLLIAYFTLRLIVRRFVPWLLSRVLMPLAAGVLIAGCVVLLIAQGLLALPFRIVRVRPPGFVFGLGDLIAAGARGSRSAVPRLAAGMNFLRHTHRLMVWALLVSLAWAGHSVTCDQEPDSLWCSRPLSAVTDLGGDLWGAGRDLFRRPGGS